MDLYFSFLIVLFVVVVVVVVVVCLVLDAAHSRNDIFLTPPCRLKPLRNCMHTRNVARAHLQRDASNERVEWGTPPNKTQVG